MLRVLAIAPLLFVWMFIEGAWAQSLVYVSLAGEKRIDCYALDLETGKLGFRHRTDAPGSPGALCVGPRGHRLFASLRSEGALASYEIGDDGRLKQTSITSAGADPAYVATDSSGRFLISAYYRAGKVAVHSINERGAIEADPLQTIDTDEKAHACVFDRTDQFLFVPHTGPNAIYQFRFDSGKLIASQPAKLTRDENTGPRHLWFHPNGQFAYGSDEQGMSVTSYQLDRKTGTLSVLQTISSLPPNGFEGRMSTSDIEVHPSGKFVYIANRGHNSISGYRMDQESGKLTYVSNSPTETTPRSFNIDPTGQYLIAAGQNSGTLATYKIQSDGKLKLGEKTPVGSRPWWVQFVAR